MSSSNPTAKLANIENYLVSPEVFATLCDFITQDLPERNRFNDLIKTRYMQSRTLKDVMCRKTDERISCSLIIDTLNTLHEGSCTSDINSGAYWKMAFVSSLKVLSLTPSSHHSSPRPKHSTEKELAPLVPTDVAMFPYVDKPKRTPDTQILLSLRNHLKQGPILYGNSYHTYIRCRSHTCKFCRSMFQHIVVTSCAEYQHDKKPCHPSMFYPHVGRSLWKQLKAKHDNGLPFEPTKKHRSLRYTLKSLDLIGNGPIVLATTKVSDTVEEANSTSSLAEHFRDTVIMDCPSPMYNPQSPDMADSQDYLMVE